MEFIKHSTFIRGLVANEDFRTRMDGRSLLQLHNLDLDITGQLKRRSGYSKWDDLENDGSITSQDTLPVVSGNQTGFQDKIQNITSFTDLSGQDFILVVTKGKVYLESVDIDGQKTWTLLNPTGKIDLLNLVDHIDVVPYLDTLFINDYKNNVLMYDSSVYSLNQEFVVGASYIYFAGSKVYFRDAVNFAADTSNTITIEDVPSNIEGKKIYDSLISVGYSAPDLPFNLGYCQVVGDTAEDFSYYVLENQLAQRDTTVYLIKFDSNLKATNRIAIPLAAGTDRILAFGVDDTFAYVWHKDAEVLKIALDGFASITMANEITGSTAPTDGTNKLFSCSVNERGLFLYSTSVTGAITDWYQPIIIDNIDFTPDTPVWTHYDFTNQSKNTETFAFVFAKDVVSNDTFIIDRNYYSTGVIESDPETFGLVKMSKDSREIHINAVVAYDTKSEDYVTTREVPDQQFGSIPTSDSRSFTIANHAIETIGAIPFHENTYIQYTNFDLSINNKLEPKASTSNTFSSVPKKLDQSHGHEILDNFTYGLELDKINIMSFSDILNNIDSEYDFDNLQDQELKFTTTYFTPSLLSDTANNNINGDAQFIKNYDTRINGSYNTEYTSRWEIVGDLTTGIPVNPIGTWTVNKSHFMDLANDPVDFDEYVFEGWYEGLPGDPYSIESFNLGGNIFLYGFNQPNTLNVATKNTDNFTVMTDIILDETREATAYGLTNRKISFHDDFAYDKSLVTPLDKQLWTASGGEFLTQDSYAYLKGNSSRDMTVFSSMTDSNFVLLLGFDTDGSLLQSTVETLDGTQYWRFMFPLGKASDLRTLQTISYQDNNLYFGTSMDRVSAVDNGILMKVNLDDLDTDNYLRFQKRSMESSNNRAPIQGDDLWFLMDDSDSALPEVRIGSWIWGDEPGDSGKQAKFPLSDYTDLTTYQSSIAYHINKNPISVTTGLEDDKLRYLGTPISPLLTIDQPANTLPGEMIDGDQYRYYVTYIFFSAEETHLSPVTQTLEIPLITGVGNTVQNMKLVISGLDLLDNRGVPIYLTTDVEFIRIYRAQKNYDATEFISPPIFIADLELDRSGNTSDYFYHPIPSPDTTQPYAAGVYEDETRSPAAVEYNTNNLQTFPCEHLLVHKNRLILVNDLEAGNTNTILYSDVDLAQAINRGNFRDIESGDGDRLVAGYSMEDFLYLFKETKIYAILGDVSNGQLIDVDRTIGCPYKNMVTEYNNKIYFLNRDGIYMIQGRTVVDIEALKLDDFFNEHMGASINFNLIATNGFTYVDTRKQDIYFYLPLKDDRSNLNTGAIIYNTLTRSFRTYSWAINVFTHTTIKDLDGDKKVLIGGYDGDIKELDISNKDDDKNITFRMNTKAFNLSNNFLRKAYNLIRVHGRYLKGTRVTYSIDGERMTGAVSYKQKRNGMGELIMVLPNRGNQANEIEVEIVGSNVDSNPTVIDDIMLGVTPLRTLR